MPTPRPLLHIYLADQDWESTSSLGIFKYSRCLLAALLAGPDPGWDVVVSVNRRNQARLLAEPLPAWCQIHVLNGPRLWLDHVRCPWLTWRLGAAAVFFPKGWVSAFLPAKTKVLATLHDTILDHYAEHHPGFFSARRLRYFRWATRHGLAKADVLFTVSCFSRQELCRRHAMDPQRLAIMPEGSTLPARSDPPLPFGERKGFLVMGSRQPHKRTAETLALLARFQTETGFREPVYLLGGGPVPHPAPQNIDVLPRLSEEELARRLGSVRALVHLSEIEGFGLPVVEAYSRQTPVVFRDAHAFHEILGSGDPGAWDGQSPESFQAALGRVLSMSADDIAATSRRLAADYTWERAAAVFRESLRNLPGEPS